ARQLFGLDRPGRARPSCSRSTWTATARRYARQDTGHMRSTSFGAGRSTSAPASPKSHGSESFSAKRRHAVVELSRGVVCVADNDRARLQALAALGVAANRSARSARGFRSREISAVAVNSKNTAPRNSRNQFRANHYGHSDESVSYERAG